MVGVLRKVEHYLVANSIENVEKRIAVLFSLCSPSTYELTRSPVAPGKPNDKMFEEHFTPTPSSIMQRFQFNAHIQSEGDSIAEFVVALRKLAQYCEFGDTLEMMRDRVGCSENYWRSPN